MYLQVHLASKLYSGGSLRLIDIATRRKQGHHLKLYGMLDGSLHDLKLFWSGELTYQINTINKVLKWAVP